MPKRTDKGMAADIIGAIREGTKKWTKTRKSEERNPASRSYRLVRMTRERTVQFREAAWEVMEKAYLQASGDRKDPANARQIMYAARKHIQNKTGKPLNSAYFTQVLLPDYLAEKRLDWDVVWDARGHFKEPHTRVNFGIGTLEVRAYLKSLQEPKLVPASFVDAFVAVRGPSGNFGAVLFIEKEGFDQLLERRCIAERFDVATMSTKGMSVVAARRLADEICHHYNVPLLVAHDFDKSGFSIAGTWQRDTRRYEFQNDITVIDLGLNLADVREMGLESEYQHHAKGSKAALMDNMRENSASEEEIAFMFEEFDQLRCTRRVELNAMTSPQFIEWLERKLLANGVRKIVPEPKLLATVYTGMVRGKGLKEAFNKLEKDKSEIEIPKDLQLQVRAHLKKHPEISWHTAMAEIVDPTTKMKTEEKTQEPTPEEPRKVDQPELDKLVRNVLGGDFYKITDDDGDGDEDLDDDDLSDIDE
jgi:hypothetical protein